MRCLMPKNLLKIAIEPIWISMGQEQLLQHQIKILQVRYFHTLIAYTSASAGLLTSSFSVNNMTENSQLVIAFKTVTKFHQSTLLQLVNVNVNGQSHFCWKNDHFMLWPDQFQKKSSNQGMILQNKPDTSTKLRMVANFRLCYWPKMNL